MQPCSSHAGARAYVKLQVRGVGDCRTSNVPIEAPSEARSGVSARLPTAHAALIETCLRGLLPEQATTRQAATP